MEGTQQNPGLTLSPGLQTPTENNAEPPPAQRQCGKGIQTRKAYTKRQQIDDHFNIVNPGLESHQLPEGSKKYFLQPKDYPNARPYSMTLPPGQSPNEKAYSILEVSSSLSSTSHNRKILPAVGSFTAPRTSSMLQPGQQPTLKGSFTHQLPGPVCELNGSGSIANTLSEMPVTPQSYYLTPQPSSQGHFGEFSQGIRDYLPTGDFPQWTGPVNNDMVPTASDVGSLKRRIQDLENVVMEEQRLRAHADAETKRVRQKLDQTSKELEKWKGSAPDRINLAKKRMPRVSANQLVNSAGFPALARAITPSRYSSPYAPNANSDPSSLGLYQAQTFNIDQSQIVNVHQSKGVNANQANQAENFSISQPLTFDISHLQNFDTDQSQTSSTYQACGFNANQINDSNAFSISQPQMFGAYHAPAWDTFDSEPANQDNLTTQAERFNCIDSGAPAQSNENPQIIDHLTFQAPAFGDIDAQSSKAAFSFEPGYENSWLSDPNFLSNLGTAAGIGSMAGGLLTESETVGEDTDRLGTDLNPKYDDLFEDGPKEPVSNEVSKHEG